MSPHGFYPPGMKTDSVATSLPVKVPLIDKWAQEGARVAVPITHSILQKAGVVGVGMFEGPPHHCWTVLQEVYAAGVCHYQ